ncbi:MAG TPA: DUF2298 domain-containing protein [Chloroflexota bacterium]|nr:DUF2298 domain-containing protein [Chloroflexota bacterium]
MLDVLRWYIAVQLCGLVGLPYATRFFRGLPDRGYAFARPLGLLILGVVLWFGAIFGFWENTGAVIAVLLLVLGAAGWLGFGEGTGAVRDLWRARRHYLLAIEGVFAAAFLICSVCRAYFPEIQATEKPMDFMFLNAIIRSPRFPPLDPWLAGYSISYYYLGYLLIAVLTELSGVAPAVAFNLAIAMLFALSVTGAFALARALVEGLQGTAGLGDGAHARRAGSHLPWIGGGLGALFVAVLGNWEGVLELLHAHGVGGSAFWRWIGINGLDHPFFSRAWYPTDPPDTWWWFRASRIIADYPPGGGQPLDYTINEFPFFSFLLGDLHPHVMALPFAFVCLGYALSFLRLPVENTAGWIRREPVQLVFIAFLFGALFLLNAWDMLTYLFVLVCVFAVRRYLGRPAFDLAWIRDTALFGLSVLAASIALYWPFYVTFRSQATGLLGIVTVHSHLRHFLIFWGPLVFLAGSLLVAELVGGISPLPRQALAGSGPAWTRQPIVWAGVGVVTIAAVLAGIPVYLLILPMLVAALALILRYLAGLSSLVDRQTVVMRTEGGRRGRASVVGGAVPASLAAEHVFVLILLFTSLLLLLGTELVYVDDSFHDRMNTVFKLYYQAWQMLAMVGAYALCFLGRYALGKKALVVERAHRLGQLVAAGWLGLAVVLIGAALVYAPAAVAARSQGFSTTPTLDGLQYYSQYQPFDAAAIQWLREHVAGAPVVLEATGGSYSEFGNVAWMTGLPTLLGWDFHEVQWRGAAISGIESERKRDIDTLYQTTDANLARTLLAKYGVTYVYVGPLERRVYSEAAVGLEKFRSFMDVVYQNQEVTIYRIRGAS